MFVGSAINLSPNMVILQIKQQSEPVSYKEQVRIILLWYARRDSLHYGVAAVQPAAGGCPQDIRI